MAHGEISQHTKWLFMISEMLFLRLNILLFTYAQICYSLQVILFPQQKQYPFLLHSLSTPDK